MRSSKTYKPVLAVVLPRFPYPLEKGDKLRAYHQLVDLSVHFEVHLICTTDIEISTEDYQKVADLCSQIHVFKLKKWRILMNLALSLLDQKPIQVWYFHQQWIHKKIQIILREIQPDHIYCQLIRSSEYVKNYHNCPKTIDYMDALSKGMERRIERSWGLKKWIFRIEHKRLTTYERQIFDYFEHQTIISAQDRNYIMHPDRQSITLIPNGVDQRFFEEIKLQKKYTLVFTGNMGYPPNVEATEFIAKKIMPLVLLQHPTVNCLISGANPAPHLRSLEHPHFHIGGWVEDMRTSYATSSIFIAPMMLGTGLQNKLLEAMAMGLPCITTSLANNALMATPDVQILIADDAAAFANQIHRLLTDRELYLRIATEGRTFVKKQYQWQQATNRLVALIQDSEHEQQKKPLLSQ